MKATKDETNHVATLPRLELSEDEIGKFTRQMGNIINMAHQLAEADTEGVPEIVQVVDRETDSREDKPEHWESHAELVKNVPEKAGGLIKMPVITSKDDNE